MENSYRFFENRECRYFPCHTGLEAFNCLFCYCPLYHKETCPGNPVYVEKQGVRIKVCRDCTFPHRPENYDVIIKSLKDSGQK
ncbi:MAG: metal-binding protein [Lachnospiraceae bacterium]|nr:metal-binding protein [Lachnospiraceae bacterium]